MVVNNSPQSTATTGVPRIVTISVGRNTFLSSRNPKRPYLPLPHTKTLFQERKKKERKKEEQRKKEEEEEERKEREEEEEEEREKEEEEERNKR